MGEGEQRTVRVPAARLAAWTAGFEARHGPAAVEASSDHLELSAADGARARVVVPFAPWHPVVDGPAEDAAERQAADLAAHVLAARRTLVLLVRRGGYLCAVLEGPRVLGSKVGRGRVQGRTAAGGWSQQRYARRRENQTDQLVHRVADAAVALLGTEPPAALVTGGSLAEKVLADPRLSGLADLPEGTPLDVVEPRPSLVRELPVLVSQVRVVVHEAGAGD